MAKHKSSVQSNSSDKFVVRVFIGFGVLFAVLIVSLLVFNANKKVYAYEDFVTLTDFGGYTTQSEEKYIVYYYSDNCGYCDLIKTDVLSFADSNDADVKVYLMNASGMTGTNPFPEGHDLFGTPAMHVVVNGVITNSYLGSLQIPEALDSINAGTHAAFQ